MATSSAVLLAVLSPVVWNLAIDPLNTLWMLVAAARFTARPARTNCPRNSREIATQEASSAGAFSSASASRAS